MILHGLTETHPEDPLAHYIGSTCSSGKGFVASVVVNGSLYLTTQPKPAARGIENYSFERST